MESLVPVKGYVFPGINYKTEMLGSNTEVKLDMAIARFNGIIRSLLDNVGNYQEEIKQLKGTDTLDLILTHPVTRDRVDLSLAGKEFMLAANMDIIITTFIPDKTLDSFIYVFLNEEEISGSGSIHWSSVL